MIRRLKRASIASVDHEEQSEEEDRECRTSSRNVSKYTVVVD